MNPRKMIRREFLIQQAAVGVLALTPGPALSQIAKTPIAKTPIMRAIPRTGETLPIIGLGGSTTFGKLASNGETEALRTLLQVFVENGGKVFDTAPMYGGGDTDRVAGSILADLQIHDDIFWATKVNVLNLFNSVRNIFGLGKPAADPEDIDKQLEQSFAYYGRKTHRRNQCPQPCGCARSIWSASRTEARRAGSLHRRYDNL